MMMPNHRLPLKFTLNDNGMLDKSNLQDLKQLFSAFSDIEKDDDEYEDSSKELPNEVTSDES